MASIDSIAASWMIKEGNGYIGQVDGAPRTVRFTTIDGKSCDWTLPTSKLARQFMGLVLRAHRSTPRPAGIPAAQAILMGDAPTYTTESAPCTA